MASAQPRLISTDYLERTIFDLVAAVRSQEAEIKSLKETVQRLEAATAPQGAMERLLGALESADRRISECARAVVVPAVDGIGHTTVGAVAADTAFRLALLERRANGQDSAPSGGDALVSAKQLRDTQRLIEQQLSSSMSSLSQQCAPLAAVASLESTVEEQSAQQSAMQGVLSTKVDRSELASLRTVAAGLRAFDGWRQAADGDIKELYSKCARTEAASDASLDSLGRLSSVVQGIADAQRLKADITALNDVRDAAAAAASLAEARVSQASLQAAVQAADDRAAQLSSRLERDLSTRLASVDTRVDGLATGLGAARNGAAAALDAAVASFRADLALLAKEVDKRAYVSALEASDDAASDLQAGVAQLSQQTAVCLRFIEWYAGKGEAYEYNSAALERHMNALATGNRARTVDSARAAALGVPAAAPPPGRGGPITGAAGVRIGGVAAS